MTSKRTRNSRARARRKQIEAQHPIDDAWAGPEALKALQRFIPMTLLVERHGVWLNPHEADLVDRYEGTTNDPEFVEALQRGTSCGPGDPMIMDWVGPQDHCLGITGVDGVEHLYHRPDCGHDRDNT